ncbi:hypothetical protein L1887_55581 [Cichorium endivia]|nr:hypothetical protein L1887_55581 [Cichorium endivia]
MHGSAPLRLFLALSAALLCLQTAEATGVNEVVTTNGVVSGHIAPDRKNTVEYLGIPYAQPPIGKLRFAPPQPIVKKLDYNASEWSVSGNASYPGLTPQAQDPETPKASRILRQSSGFSIGNSNSKFYDGSRFAEATSAIIITLTYRLNVFGFPGAPDSTQNLGLRDQRLAVQWIHDNIAGFGGDPSKITVFGQSSGGVAVDWWTFAYRQVPLIAGIISESGNALSFPLNTAERQKQNWYNVSTTLGCGSSGDTLECVRGKDWKDLLAAAGRLPAAPGGNPVRSTSAFYPMVDNETVFPDYRPLLEQGKFAKLNHSLAPNDIEARARSAQGVPTWQYRYFGDWSNTRLYSSSGAYHGTELEMLFGNSGDVSGIAPFEAQEELTKVMQNAWGRAYLGNNLDQPFQGCYQPAYEAFDREMTWRAHLETNFCLLAAQKEQENVLYRSKEADPKDDFLLLPDLNWDHVPDQPTYYHFHIHVVHVNLDPSATQAVGKALALDNVISQLDTLGGGDDASMADVELSYTVGEASELWTKIFLPLKEGKEPGVSS